MNSPTIFFANLAWFLSCLPGWAAFLAASRNVRRAQTKVLARILDRNAGTEIGRRRRFADVRTPADLRALPLSEYEDYAADIEAVKAGKPLVLSEDRVEALLPTSGSTAATKWIPCTASLRKEFQAAVDPWMASLYFAHPALLLGKHYWSVSPATPSSTGAPAGVPTGFPDDTGYLGPVQRRLARALFAVPPEISRVADRDAFEYITLLFLLRERNLRLISVWHPSFLTVLMKAAVRHQATLARDIERGALDDRLALEPGLREAFTSRLRPNPVRAKEIREVGTERDDFPGALWSRLRVISCWTDGRAEPWLSELARAFPRASIQGKGLMATEGVVSFPLGADSRKVCAIRSHFFEFVGTEHGEVRNAWDVEAGKTYSVVLTTGGGLYRYRLHDVVRVTGFHHQAPCLAFLSRDNQVSDLVGEKLNAWHVDDCVRGVEAELDVRFPFAMLAPRLTAAGPGYVFYVQASDSAAPDFTALASALERRLADNYHYRHARRLSQLQPVAVFRIRGDATAAYRDGLLRKGLKAGDIKFTSLSSETDWDTVFPGDIVAYSA